MEGLFSINIVGGNKPNWGSPRSGPTLNLINGIEKHDDF